MQATSTHVRFAANGVSKEGIAAINDDVTLIHGICKLSDYSISGFASLYHDQRTSGAFQGRNKLFDCCGRDEVTVLTVLSHESIGFFRAAIVYRHRVVMAGKVSGNVRAHHSQANNANLCKCFLISHGSPSYPDGMGMSAKGTTDDHTLHVGYCLCRRPSSRTKIMARDCTNNVVEQQKQYKQR